MLRIWKQERRYHGLLKLAVAVGITVIFLDAAVVIVGAACSGPTFIAQLGLGKVIQYILDDYPQKVHKYSPGDRIPVLPTEELYKPKPDYVVILAWIHAKKIIENNRKYLEQGGYFVVCCPDIQVIDTNTAVTTL